MATIDVQGLGLVEIKGNLPNEEEQNAIIEALQNNTDLETSTDETSSLNLTKPQPKGLELIGGRPTFEAIGGIAGGVAGTPAGPMGIVGGGTLGTAGAGQLYDVVQGYIADEPKSLMGQFNQAKKDLSREAVLQTFFAKLPGMGRYLKSKLVNKNDPKTKSLYESAKSLGYPLSISDTGNMVGKGYGRVIGVFPWVGNPQTKAMVGKANLLNKTANDTLNSFAPNVSLTNLGVDMVEAAKSTYGDFRRVTKFFYDDFYNTAGKIKQPVISTQNFSKSAKDYVKLIEDGKIKIGGKNIKSPQKDAIYKYAKDISKIDPFINISQYKSLVKDMQKFAKLSQKEGYDLKSIMGLKDGLETDLRLLTNPKYYNQFNKVVDVTKMQDLANKLKFADKVYVNGLENSMITKTMKEQAKKNNIKLKEISGKKLFEKGAGKSFEKVDKNIFGPGFEKFGGVYADGLAEAMLKNKNLTPQLLDDLSSLVGKNQYQKFVRKVFQKGYDNSLVDNGVNGLMFDPFKFEDALGLTTQNGRDIIKTLLKESPLKIEQLDNFFEVAKNHGSLNIPDVSSFIMRRATLGGTKSVLGGMAMGYSTFNNPVRGLGLISLARKGTSMINNPKNLELVMNSLDYNAPGYKVWNSIYKLTDNLLKDETNNFETNSMFDEVREYLEVNKDLLIEEFDKDKEDD